MFLKTLKSMDDVKRYIKEAEAEALMIRGQENAMQKKQTCLDGITFEDYKKYTYTEPAKHIAWNLYAKTRELYVRNYERKEYDDITILCDNYKGLEYGDNGCSKWEMRNKLLSLLLVSYIKKGRIVNVLFHGKKDFRRYSVKSMNDIVETLTSIMKTPSNYSSFDTKRSKVWRTHHWNFAQSLIWLTDMSNIQEDCNLSLLRFSKKYIFKITDISEERNDVSEIKSWKLLDIPMPKWLGKKYSARYRAWESSMRDKMKGNRFQMIPFYTHKSVVQSYVEFLRYAS